MRRFPGWIVSTLVLVLLNSIQCQSCECSHENFDIYLERGIFKSPEFPTNYCDNLDCIYEIEPKNDWSVALVIEHFDTEMSHDYAEIYESVSNSTNNRQYVKLSILSGQIITQRHFFSALGEGLRVNFVTDASESDFSGFQMSFYRFEKGNRHNVPCPPPFHIATSASKTLPELSPRFRAGSLCAFQINSTEAIQITIHELATPLTTIIYETENFNMKHTGKILESLNGFALKNLPHIITSRTSSLTVIISVPLSLNANIHHTYNVQFKSVLSVCNCPPTEIQLDHGETHSFVSPGFPLEYCDLENCTTHAVVHPKSTQTRNVSVTSVVRAHIESFHLETDVDYLEMADQKVLIALTDVAKSISYFTFDHPQAIFKFITDHSVTDRGFNLTLDIYQKPYYCECPGSPQILQEEKYVQNYTFEEECRFMDCFWEIRLPRAFQINGLNEFIEVSNGPNLERNQQLLRLDIAMFTSENSAERHIEFEDSQFVYVWYHREGDLDGGSRYLDIEYVWREKCLCGSQQLIADSDEWKQLASPDYPMPYCNELNCTYYIRAPFGHNILINVTDFFTEINSDFLMIFDGNSTQQRHLEALSGMELFTNLLRSKSEEMTLLFISDRSVSMRGFALWYKAEKVVDASAADGDAARSTHFFSIPHITIFLLLTVIIGLIIYVIHLRDSRTFDTDTVVRYVGLR